MKDILRAQQRSKVESSVVALVKNQSDEGVVVDRSGCRRISCWWGPCS